MGSARLWFARPVTILAPVTAATNLRLHIGGQVRRDGWTVLNVQPKVGQELMFDLAIDDSADGKGRLRQLMWNGGEKNSSDRSYWGRIKLIP